MQAWTASPYRSVGVYLGGVNRACSQTNLTSGWVGGVTAMGWGLIPIYVGLQSPSMSGCSGCARIDPAQPLQQGAGAANDAEALARSLGIGPSSPIFYDMEGYDNSNQASVNATMAFLAAWTVTLHGAGYRSGVYSSAASGISDLVARAGTNFAEPDELWIAHWTGKYSTSDPYVPANLWVHQRMVQYAAGVTETYGGRSLTIDQNAVDAPLAAAGAGPYVTRTYPQLLGRSADQSGFQYWSGYLDFGGTRSVFTGSLAGSWEFAMHTSALDYQGLLHRTADPSGQTLWAFVFAVTGHNDQVAAQIAASAEYWTKAAGTPEGFVASLYRDFLGRTAGPSEAAYWTGLMARGYSRYAVALLIASGTEAVTKGVVEAYWTVVHADPDPGGLAYWRDQIERTGDPRPLLASLAASSTAWYG